MLKNSQFADRISELLGSLFKSLPLHPTTYTLLSVVLAAAGLVSWVQGPVSWVMGLEFRVLGFALFLLALFIDAIDGAVARAKNLTSKQGAFLDGISDRLVEFFIVLALFFSFANDIQMQLALIVVLFFGTCMTAFVKAYAEHFQLLNHESAAKMPGLLERAERTVLLMIIISMIVFGNEVYVVYLVWVVALLAFATFVQRVSLIAKT